MEGRGVERGERDYVCVYVCVCECKRGGEWGKVGEGEGEKDFKRERQRVFAKSESLLKERQRNRENAWKDWKFKRRRGREIMSLERERVCTRETQRVVGKIESLLKERTERDLQMLNNHHDLHSSQCYLKWCGLAASWAQHSQWDIVIRF